jgi:hypothetical protein
MMPGDSLSSSHSEQGPGACDLVDRLLVVVVRAKQCVGGYGRHRLAQRDVVDVGERRVRVRRQQLDVAVGVAGERRREIPRQIKVDVVCLECLRNDKRQSHPRTHARIDTAPDATRMNARSQTPTARADVARARHLPAT